MTPLSYWLWFHLAVIVLLAIEYAIHRAIPDPRRKAAWAIALWTAAAITLAAILAPHYTTHGAVEYLAGYAIEESLSIDNLFVFLLLFGLFHIPAVRQPKILFWGVAGAILMRGLFIAAGLGLLARFHWVEYIFAAILLIAAIRLLKPEAKEPGDPRTPAFIRWLSNVHPISQNQDHFLVRESPAPGEPARRMATVLLLALIAVELTDVIFALDSIPAVLSITRVPFLAYTSNIMAVMGLRSLYVLLAAALAKLRFVHFGIAAVLGFAALKMLLADWITIGPLVSLAVIGALLAITITASLLVKPANTLSS